MFAVVFRLLSAETPEKFRLMISYANVNANTIRARDHEGSIKIYGLELHVCCLTPLSTIFQLYHGDQLYWLRKREKPIDLTPITDKLYHIILFILQWVTLQH